MTKRKTSEHLSSVLEREAESIRCFEEKLRQKKLRLRDAEQKAQRLKALEIAKLVSRAGLSNFPKSALYAGFKMLAEMFEDHETVDAYTEKGLHLLNGGSSEGTTKFIKLAAESKDKV
jgi:hypothetical protein